MRHIIYLMTLIALMLVAAYLLIQEERSSRAMEQQVERLQYEIDSLTELTQTQHDIVLRYRQHLGRCSFIGREQINKVTNHRWIELTSEYGLMVAHRELSMAELNDYYYDYD